MNTREIYKMRRIGKIGQKRKEYPTPPIISIPHTIGDVGVK